MKLVEKHIFKNRKDIDNIAFLSKNLYNYTNYIIRQAFTERFDNIPEYKDLINNKNFMGEYDLSKRMAKLNQVDYRALPSQTSQAIIKLIYNNWKSYFKAIKDYKVHPEKYKGPPKIPKYKDKKNGRNIIVFTNQTCRLKGGRISFPKSTKIKQLRTKIKKEDFCQVRIIPRTNCYVVEVIYNKEIKETKNVNLNKKSYISIDLGVDNVGAITSNQTDLKPFLINGRIMKSINQYYNKSKAKYQSLLPKNKHISKRILRLTLKRNNKIEDSMHKISRCIVNYCVKNRVGNIVIGYNEGWKREVNMGKATNQKFVDIPFASLIQKITYKASLVGINVMLTNEAHTSKCDSLALETIGHHDKYLGKRVKRGLFQSSVGRLINADSNGSINSLRKVIGDDFLKGLTDRGVGLAPYRINIY